MQRFSGVQCKDRDGRLGTALSTTELQAECKKARSFRPDLGDFTIATTAARNETLQKSARTMTVSRQFPFDVYVWSWEDIEGEIRTRPRIAQIYYPGIQLSAEGSPQVRTSVVSHRDQCLAFFSRPEILYQIPFSLREVLLPLCYELIDNAYRHGGASRFTITCEDSVISFEDNGIAFDPTRSLDASKVTAISHVGSYVFDAFRRAFRGEVELRYERDVAVDSGLNRLSLMFKRPTRLFPATSTEVNVDLSVAIGRGGAERLAASLELQEGAKEVILNVTEYANISALVEFIRYMLVRIGPETNLVIYLPRHWLLEALPTWIKDPRLSVRFR